MRIFLLRDPKTGEVCIINDDTSYQEVKNLSITVKIKKMDIKYSLN